MALGVGGEAGLRERGEEKVRIGRGRGVFKTREDVELELEDDEMTEAFLLRSARVGTCPRECSGEGVVTSIFSMVKSVADGDERVRRPSSV